LIRQFFLQVNPSITWQLLPDINSTFRFFAELPAGVVLLMPFGIVLALQPMGQIFSS